MHTHGYIGRRNPRSRTDRCGGERVHWRRSVERSGNSDLKIPKLRARSFFPAMLKRRRRVDQSLFGVVMETCVHRVSTHKVDDLIKALGSDAEIAKSEVSRICAGLDTEVAGFRDWTLAAQDFPYGFLDATYCQARVDHPNRRRRGLSQPRRAHRRCGDRPRTRCRLNKTNGPARC